MRRIYASIVASIFTFSVTCSLAGTPLLLQKPTLSKSQIAFVYANDIWIMDREGGVARRLTTGPGVETDPSFSPDGSTLAFTGEYDGNTDVYVVAAVGGAPKRLTFHPGSDRAVGWALDGKRVLFASSRHSAFGNNRLFTIPVAGGFPEELPLPTAEEGTYSPDGGHLAYVPTMQWQKAWKRYRGGQTKPVWIVDLADSSIVKLPRENSNDFNPMWVGDKIYFLSDRSGPVTLYSYDCASKEVRQAIQNEGLDFKSASAGPDGIVIEQFGALRFHDLRTGSTKTLSVTLAGDLAELRPRFKGLVGKDIESGKMSPTGQRAVFEVRGEIITVPAEKGDARNLTRTAGVAERDPAWSPDGKWIAYFSEESGEYALHISEQSGQGETKQISMGTPPSFFYSPVWSPDSKKIACTDKRGKLWRLDLEFRKPILIDTNTFSMKIDPPAWSSDSRWLAYARKLPNRMSAIFVHNLEDGKNHQVTDGMSDAAYPCFDATGKYLFFAASTDLGPLNGWGDLSTMNRPATRSIYLAVLDKTNSSPLAIESDEEKVEAKKEGASKEVDTKQEKKPGKKKKESGKTKDTNAAPDMVKIDFENLSQRILALPMPARNYLALASGKSNILFALEGPLLEEPSPSFALHKFDMAKRKAEKFVEGIRTFDVSHNREKLLYRKGENWIIASTDAPPKGDEKTLNFASTRLAIDPPVEWRQIYREVWRIERDFLYAPNHHGLNLEVASRRYAPYLEGLASRSDLNYLFEEMLGELTVGHMFVGGGDMPKISEVHTGLLGADYRIENGRYRFARVYDGENWNPQLRAPLTEPGIGVAEGEYLLAVDGRDLAGSQNIFELFVDKADKTMTLRVGKNADGKDSRDVKVRPVGNEHDLRNRAWVEDNRRKVIQLSEGHLAYVYLPDTAKGGYDNFNRYYFAQADKDGFIIDERFNGGGYLADYVVDYLRRSVLNYITTREGEDTASPWGANAGPKVMIINEFAGSGGDALPWYFRKLGIGALVGKRTWGGLVGIDGYPALIDGGYVMAPHLAGYGTQGEWEVENRGIAPDVEVEFDPKAWRSGRDLQLEKAVELALESLKKNPPQKPKRPEYPNYHQ